MAVAKGRVSTTQVVPKGIPDGWEHLEDEGQWVPRDSSYGSTGVLTPGVGLSPTVMVVEPINVGPTADFHAVTKGSRKTILRSCDAQIV